MPEATQALTQITSPALTGATPTQTPAPVTETPTAVFAPPAPAQSGGNQNNGNTPVPIDLGQNTTYVGPRLWGTLQKHSDGETAPARIDVEFGTLSNVVVTPDLDHLSSAT